MPGNYILENGQAVPCTDIHKWAAWYETAERHVGDDEIDGYRVSTVFLGLDHNFGGGAPLLYETMIFCEGPLNNWAARYSTWSQAEAGHQKVLDAIRYGRVGDLLTDAERIRDLLTDGD